MAHNSRQSEPSVHFPADMTSLPYQMCTRAQHRSHSAGVCPAQANTIRHTSGLQHGRFRVNSWPLCVLNLVLLTGFSHSPAVSHTTSYEVPTHRGREGLREASGLFESEYLKTRKELSQEERVRLRCKHSGKKGLGTRLIHSFAVDRAELQEEPTSHCAVFQGTEKLCLETLCKLSCLLCR